MSSSNHPDTLTDRVSRTVYSTDNSIYQLEPTAISLPASADEIGAVMQANSESDEPKPLVARGGGTGTNGQSLTNGLVLDLKRRMNQIIALDVDQRTVIVEPGVVTAALNAELAEHGLFWPPHTSTLSRATVGGMISTDAAGKGSLVHGRAHRHVERLEVVLDDGTPWTAEAISIDQAEQRASATGRGAEIWQKLLDLPLGPNAAPGLTDLGLPELARGFSGYGIDRLRRDGVIDPVALLCGAEGTLAVITQATLRLSPIPDQVRLVVASYDSFGEALEEAVRLRDTGPSAIESFDETTLERGRASTAWPALGEVVGDHQGGVLLLEYSGEAAANADQILGVIRRSGTCREASIIDDGGAQASVWKVRADAVGLLAKVAVGGPELSARPTAFVEDCAVPVAEMPAFIGGFRQILDEAGVTYGMFGHADVGCVHVRPALDLTAPEHQALVAQITADVTALVARHGGLLWGEHGRGFRGSSIDQVLPAPTIDLMRAVKEIFDPRDLLNPGKLYRPTSSDKALLDVTDPPLRGESDAEVAVQLRTEFSDAFACNGNGLCHHYSATEVMCPSYKVTGDPALSPKGRVDLIRAWLREPGRDAAFEKEIAANLDQCLSCSACAGHCPVEVDIPELKSQFFEGYHQRHARPASHQLLSRFETLAVLGTIAGPLARLGVKPAERLLGLVDLPAPKGAFKPTWRPGGRGALVDLVILPDVFTAAIEPNTLADATFVLKSLGWSVGVASFTPSGKFDHVKGQRKSFGRIVDRQRKLVNKVVESGSIPIVIEPAIALLHRHEYPAIDPDFPASAVRTLAEVLLGRADQLPQAPEGSGVRVLGHCTERATQPSAASAWVRVFEAAGFDVVAPEIGCCGMAGIFGHEVDNQQMSHDLWDLSWDNQLHVDDERTVVAPGYSCRSQAERFGDRSIPHPVEILARLARESA